MKLSFSILAVLSAIPAILAADSKPNPFKIPEAGLNTKAGTTLNLSWSPTTSGTISLILRSGASSNLDQGAFIAQKIQNSGDFAWNVPDSITRGSDYTVEIVSDSDPTQMNYTPYFVIDSDVTVATATGKVTLGAPSEALAGTATGTVSATSTSMPSSSGTDSMTGTDTKTMTMTMTSSSSSSSDESSSSSSSASDSSSADAESATSTNADASATTTDTASSTGGAVAHQIPIVAAGIVAIGALVL